jgi:tetratricopeptide (TPR) repeat protein
MSALVRKHGHVWVTGADRAGRARTIEMLQPIGRRIDVEAHRRLRGPYTAAGTVLRKIVPDLISDDPRLVKRHDVEILTAAPELEGLVVNRHATLTSMAAPQERTRFYPRAHSLRIANGLCELVIAWAKRQDQSAILVLDRLDAADATDQQLAAIMLRRADPAQLRLILGTTSAPHAEPLFEPLAEALRQYAIVRLEAPRVHEPTTRTHRSTHDLAAAFLASDCTSEDPAEREAYQSMPEAARAELHDQRSQQLEALGELSLRLGAIPFHRARGSDPAGAGFESVRAALERCVLTGCYHAVLELGERAHGLIDAGNRPEDAWLVTAKVVTALTALGRPEEAAAEYDAAAAASSLPIAHLQIAYGRAMLYTRFYADNERDHAKAKAWINTAIAIAKLLPEAQWRAFNLTLNENGLALIEMHLGDLNESLRLINAGLERLDQELGTSRHTLQKSVLRYNRAQLLVRLQRTDEALRAYDELVEIDPNHSEYHLERAALLRTLGRLDDARADLDVAISVSPPYPEPYYNRGDLWLELGEAERAAEDFGYVLELDPAFVDAYLNRASALCELGRYDEAEQDVMAGLRLAPDSAHLHGLQGMILQSRGRIEDADRAYAAALAIDPEMIAVWANRAALAFDRGDSDGAVAHLGQAIELAGASPGLLANRALAHEQAGRWSPAAADLSAAIEQADGSERAEYLWRRAMCRLRQRDERRARRPRDRHHP